MKILLVAIGSRGDVEPFLALGSMLSKDRGCEIGCIFPEQYRDLAEDEGFQFFSLGTEFIDMIDSDEGRDIMGGNVSGLKKIGLYIKLYRMSKSIHAKHMELQDQYFKAFQADRIIYHVKSVYATAYSVIDPGKSIILSPVPCLLHKMSDYPTLGFSFSLGKWFNRWSYALTNLAMLANIKTFAKPIATIRAVTKAQLRETILNTPLLFSISPALIDPDPDWPGHVKLVGYHERDKQSHWQPDEALEQFLDNHVKPIMVTFGSMTNPNPVQKTRIIVDILTTLRIPAIFNLAAGGLVMPEDYDPTLFHVVERIPYDWLLPKLYGAIHHGGSGTTHMMAKYGCVSLILPHIIDQFLWDRLTVVKGIGPKGVGIAKITKDTLLPIIKDFYTNPQYQVKAKEAARQMATEDYKSTILETVFGN